MIVYNVTINIANEHARDWLTYMIEEHLPDVMKTGCFLDYRICEMLTRQADEEGITYSIQYTCQGMEDYETYREKHSPKLQQEHSQKFAGKFVAFRSLMEVVA